MPRTAHCSCGALRLETSGEPDHVMACHCQACQRRTGSAFGLGAYFRKDSVRVEGASTVFVRPAPEGRVLRNHFCPTCGTTLFWAADRLPDHIGIAVGGFDAAKAFRPTISIWEGAGHDWATVAGDIPHFPGTRPA